MVKRILQILRRGEFNFLRVLCEIDRVGAIKFFLPEDESKCLCTPKASIDASVNAWKEYIGFNFAIHNKSQYQR